MGTTTSPVARDEAPGAEQRQSARKTVSEPIAVELQPGHEVWLHDLGEGGLSVSGTSPLELGTSASFRFELPEADSVIDAAGIVAWNDTSSGRAGVRFTRVEPDSTAALRRWLKSGAGAHPPNSDGSLYNHELATKVACLREVADLQAVISSEHLERDAALDLIVRRMAELTRASGAAIALREGQDVVCRASFGSAPDIGVKLSTSSLSGECLRTGTIVLLEDSETEPRVNRDVCRQLNFRSLLALPISSGTNIVGIAEVLSPNLRNFEGGDVLVVSFLTDLVSSVAVPHEEDRRPQVFAVFEAEAAPAMVDRGPEEGLVGASAAELAASLPISLRTAAQDRARGAEQVHPIPITARFLPTVVVAVLLATALLLFGYYYRLGHPASAKTAPAATLSSAPPPASSTTYPPSTGGTSARASTQAKPSRVARSTSATVKETPQEATEVAVIQGRTVSVTPAPETAAPEPLEISALDVRGSDSMAASIVAAQPATPNLGTVQSLGVTPGKLIKRVLPQYPETARRAGVAGEVVIAGIIGTDGILHDLRVLSGSSLLRDAALEAARQWRYSPYLLGGRPIESNTQITIRFH